MISEILSMAVASITFLVYYRLYLHPLANYPGPLIGRLTDWYNVYHCLKGDRHLDFVLLHQIYGKLVRYGPNRLSINSAPALQMIYGSKANTKKSYFYNTMQFYMDVPSTHATIDKEAHAKKRRVLAQALSDKMLHIYEAGFLKTLEKFLDIYESETTTNNWSKPYDLGLGFTLFSFDAMDDFCFGQGFESLQNPAKADILNTTAEGLRGANAVGHMPAIASLKLDLLNPRLTKAMNEYKAYSTELARDCIARPEATNMSASEPRSVLDVLLRKRKHDTKESFSTPELVSESSLLVSAGSDTTAHALTNIVFNLLNNPHTLHRLTAEVRSKFDSINQIRLGPALQDCEYLSACIEEGMRLMPPIGGCLQRCVLSGGITIEGHTIPEGTDVGVPHHTIMRNGEYFEDPWSFEPRRWMPYESGDGAVRQARSAFCPFSLGPAGCIGKTWAMIEIRLTLAQLVFRFDMEMVLASDRLHLPAVSRLREREEEYLDRFGVGGHGPLVKFRATH